MPNADDRMSHGGSEFHSAEGLRGVYAINESMLSETNKRMVGADTIGPLEIKRRVDFLMSELEEPDMAGYTMQT